MCFCQNVKFCLVGRVREKIYKLLVRPQGSGNSFHSIMEVIPERFQLYVRAWSFEQNLPVPGIGYIKWIASGTTLLEVLGAE